MITLLVMTDGRDCILQALASARENLEGIGRILIHDDSANPDYREWLHDQFSDAEITGPLGRAGFGGAIRRAWEHLAGADGYVFHLEDDFTFNRPVDLAAMVKVLELHPNLIQLALRRQPWGEAEEAAGGVVEQHPDAYVEHEDGDGNRWLEHRLFFTTNPSLYRASLCRQGWPRGAESEGRFAHKLLASPKVRFGYWGARDSGEWVTHIGHVRVGYGY